MAVVVVGGHTRNIGKTSVGSGLIAATRDCHWTAIKITQFGHGVCSANGEPCDCETADHPIAVSEEREMNSGTDSSRYLVAGALRSFWVRTRQGQLAEAMPRVRKLIAEGENVIIESNSVLRFLRPAISISVLDPGINDFKPSALRFLDRVDAIVTPETATGFSWPGVSQKLMSGKPIFRFTPPQYCPDELVSFVSQRLVHSVSPQPNFQANEVSCDFS